MRLLGYFFWPLEGRYLAFTISVVGAIAFFSLASFAPENFMAEDARVVFRSVLYTLAALFGLCALVGVRDLLQTKHAILRNYPILAHLRYFFEKIRPEMRQYFFEDDTEGRPFSRDKRALVYQRAKNALDKRPFGTTLDAYDARFEWLNHSMAPVEPSKEPIRVVIGEGRAKPYSCSVLNISGMSYGAISPNAIRSMNKGAKHGGFAQVTGEGSVSRYHLEHGGDLIWQIASGYFGCRDDDGRFHPERFRDMATRDEIKMIELKLSQGAKPGHGGVLPKAKITAEIARTRQIPRDRDCISPPMHSAFSTPIELIEFVARLRELSGGKPVGFKLCVGHRWQFLAVCKAMLEVGDTPDYIMVDGTEGGTGAAPLEFADHVGMPMRDGVNFVHNALVGAGLRDRVKVGASGQIASAFDMIRAFALGADVCHSARAFMFAVGCIQAQACHTGHCPTGVATTDPLRQRAVVVADKWKRVATYHRLTLETLAETLAAAGLAHPSQLNPHYLWRRVNGQTQQTFADLYPKLQAGELLTGATDHPKFRRPWLRAQASSFDPDLSAVL